MQWRNVDTIEKYVKPVQYCSYRHFISFILKNKNTNDNDRKPLRYRCVVAYVFGIRAFHFTLSFALFFQTLDLVGNYNVYRRKAPYNLTLSG